MFIKSSTEYHVVRALCQLLYIIFVFRFRQTCYAVSNNITNYNQNNNKSPNNYFPDNNN